MIRLLFVVLGLTLTLCVSAQKSDVEVKAGPYSPDWESLNGWECPEWFKDAKFGIWAHWGPQCHAEDGDWYARFMYYEGSGQNRWHYEHFGEPDVFGLKDLCNDWKAQKWNPEQLVSFYKSVGARYFMALANHHDNFDLWNSPYQEWNSVNVGPKKDIIKGWSEACKKAGLPLGVSVHASHAWTWLEPSQEYDGNLTKEDGYKLNADGTEKWWKGMDPQELYAQRHAHSIGWDNSGTIHSQWDWNNGASLPSDAYKRKFQNRVLQLIDDYDPAMIYFDDTAMPFYGCDDNVGKNILAHYYNQSAAKNGGRPEVVVTGKQLTKEQKKRMMWDVERGVPDRIQEDYWQTCTCLGEWHYNQAVYNRNGYNSAQQVVDMLVDIVSKNGNLLLSVPVRSDGTIDDKEVAILEGIKAWMDINGKSIYGTRPWKTFGEGPLAESANPISAQGFNEKNNYSSKDVRYVQRNDTLFATILRWPADVSFTFKSLGMGSEYYGGKVKKVELLGYGEVNCSEAVDGVTVDVPSTHPNEIAPVYMFLLDESTQNVSLKDVIEAYEEKVNQLLPQVSYNTGKFSKEGVNSFKQALDDAKAYISSSAENQKVVIASLSDAYKNMLENGRNPAGVASPEGVQDITEDKLIEAQRFTASVQGSRFGTPEYWTVENFMVPINNESAGVKNGIDGYPGFNTLSLGVWSGEDIEPYTCDVTNARIYKTVHLEPGRYFFAPYFETNYNISSNAYIFAAEHPLPTEDLEEKSIAFAHIKEAGTGKFYGIYFNLEKEQDIVLGFQANITDGSSQQEFRIKEVKLLYYGNMDLDALDQLIMDADAAWGEAVISPNTGFYTKAAVEKLKSVVYSAMDTQKELESSGNITYNQFMEVVNSLEAALKDFRENGKNPGGQPDGHNATDITVDKLTEASDFSRADKSVTTRFASPEYWTVENFKIPNGGDGTKNGLDRYPGYDCLMLGLWNDREKNEEGDLANARIYQKVHLEAGRYYFGNTFNTLYNLSNAYIFASEELIPTNQMEQNSLAYYSLMKGSSDNQFHGLFFTLDEDADVYLGFQADLSGGPSQQEFRAKDVVLYYYGKVNADALKELVETVEGSMDAVKVNENTGYYSQSAYDELKSVLDASKALEDDGNSQQVTDAYYTLNEAYNDFLVNGKNPGGEPEKLNATNVTESKLKEMSDFSRSDKSVSTRFASPEYWTVENFRIPKGGEGVKNGLDRYPGYDCLMLGLWDDREGNEDGDLANARIYQKVHLEAGRYYFGNTFNALYNLHRAYIFASEQLIPTEEMESNSLAYYSLSEGAVDGKLHGLYFTIDEDKDVYLGFQADLANGAGQQEFRAKDVVLYYYGEPTGIQDVEKDAVLTGGDAVRYYTLSGLQLREAPQHGLFIVRQQGRTYKVYKR